jgi:hypothetical protein
MVYSYRHPMDQEKGGRRQRRRWKLWKWELWQPRLLCCPRASIIFFLDFIFCLGGWFQDSTMVSGIGVLSPEQFVPGSPRVEGEEGMGVNKVLCAIGWQLEQGGGRPAQCNASATAVGLGLKML